MSAPMLAAVDALGLVLYHTKTGYKGSKVREIDLGLCKLSLNVSAALLKSDETGVCVVTRVRRSLWLAVIASGSNLLGIRVFDGNKQTWGDPATWTVLPDTPNKMIEAILASTVVEFRYDHKTSKWNEYDSSDLDQGPTVEGVQGPKRASA